MKCNFVTHLKGGRVEMTFIPNILCNVIGMSIMLCDDIYGCYASLNSYVQMPSLCNPYFIPNYWNTQSEYMVTFPIQICALLLWVKYFFIIRNIVVDRFYDDYLWDKRKVVPGNTHRIEYIMSLSHVICQYSFKYLFSLYFHY